MFALVNGLQIFNYLPMSDTYVGCKSYEGTKHSKCPERMKTW